VRSESRATDMHAGTAAVVTARRQAASMLNPVPWCSIQHHGPAPHTVPALAPGNPVRGEPSLHVHVKPANVVQGSLPCARVCAAAELGRRAVFSWCAERPRGGACVLAAAAEVHDPQCRQKELQCVTLRVRGGLAGRAGPRASAFPQPRNDVRRGCVRAVYNDGSEMMLLCVAGTIPTTFSAVVYQTPVRFWLQPRFPTDAPLCYVEPTPGAAGAVPCGRSCARRNQFRVELLSPSRMVSVSCACVSLRVG
jgi:hypothetical protein